MADLKYKALLDDSDYRKKLAELQRDTGKNMSDMFDRVAKSSTKNMEAMFKRIGTAMNKAASGVGETNSVADATRKLTARQQEAIQTMRAEREARLSNIEAIGAARVAIEQERKAIQSTKRQYEEGRISIQEYRKEMARIGLEERKRRIAEREARKAAAGSGEYQQLSRALGALRKESQNVLAEMFRLERQGKKNSVAYQELASRSRDLVAQTNVLDKGIKQIDTSLGLHHRNVGNYGSALDVISPQFARLNSQLAMMGVNLSEVAGKRNGIQTLGATLLAMGRNIGAFLLSPVGILITALTSLYLLISRNFGTIKEFNSGLLNVSKTTGIAGRELTRLGDSIIGLSRSLQTVGTDKLLEYATVAGQLGVKGTENIMAFTEALAKLETASDITGEEGGAEIARLLTLVDGGVQNVADFGDEIVNLGNNFAATEREILSNAEAISQNVGIYRFGRQDVLAFATATKSVGLEAEVVGSTFSRTLGTWSKFISTGKNLGGILRIVGGTAEELSHRFKTDASGVFMDYVRGLNRVHQSGGDVNATMRETGIIAVRDQRVIASLASNGYSVLEDAMNKVREASGALDEEFQTKASSLENQIGRIRIAWNNWVLDIENGEGVLGQAVVRFADGLATIIDRMAKITNPTGWNEFMASLTNFETADMIREINTAYSDAQEAIKSLAEFNVSTAGQDQLRDKLTEIEGVTKALNTQYQTYKKAVNDGVLTEGGKAKLDDFEQSLNTLSRSMWQIQRNVGPEAAAPPPPEADPAAEELSKQQQREREAALRNQRQLQKQIDEMNLQSLRVTMSANEQEVESVRDKYRKIRETIEEFRNDPKNKGMAVDASGLSAAQSREEAQVRYRQDTTALLKELGVQRQLWQDYESWRLELGEDSANERYAKELDVAKGFKERLAEEIATLGSMLTASLAGGDDAPKLTGVEEERLKQLQEIMRQIESQEQKRRDDHLRRVLSDYSSFEQKRVRLHKQAEDDMALMDEDGKKRRQKALEDELVELYRTEVEGNERLKEFMKTADNAGSTLALRALKHGRAYTMRLIDGMTGDPAVKARLKKEFTEFFDQSIASVEQENFGNIVQLIDGFDRLVQSAEQFDGTMSTAMKTIGSMVGQVGQLARTLGDTMGELGGNLSKGGGYMAIVGAMFSLFGSISNAIESSYARRAQKEKEARDKEIQQLNAVTKILEYQLQVVQDIYGTERVSAFLDVIAKASRDVNQGLSEIGSGYLLQDGNTGREQLLKRFREDFNGSLDELDAAIRKAEKKNNFWFRINPFRELGTDWKMAEDIFKRMRDTVINASEYEFGWNSIADITSEQVAEIRGLIEKGAFDEVMQAQLENIIAQWELWREAMNQLNQELTGTTFQSIGDEIVAMFERGNVAAEDFANNFEKLMQRAVLQSLKRNVLDKELQKWYDDFARAAESDGGLDDSEVAGLQDTYNSIIEKARKEFEMLQELSGIDFGSGSAAQGELSKGIAGITETTANRLEAEFGGLRLAQLQLLEFSKTSANQYLGMMNSQLAALNRIELNTGRVAENTGRLANIEAAIVSLNNKVRNTDSARRGAGLI